jgi:glucose/arabinose dehydrogenase
MISPIRLTLLTSAAALALTLAACGPKPLDPASQIGANPVLPEPHQYLFPPMHVAKAVKWKPGETPTVGPGLKITALATGFEHPRQPYVLPNGDILIVEANGPKGPPPRRPKEFIMGLVIGKAGGGAKGANRITLIRDANGDGVPELRSVLVENLMSPFGVAWVDGNLYVANADAIVRFPYALGETRITAPGVKLTDLPGGPINHHWTKSLVASADGTKLYAGVGSNSNITENGILAEDGRAAIWEVDRATGAKRLYATGLRNPNGLTWEPASGKLWAVINERDEIGPDLVPDYMTSVQDGAFYGWPYSYYGQHVDARVMPQRPDLVAKAIKPDYALSSHVAPLGLAFSTGAKLPFGEGAFVGEHGSWDRGKLNGYKVIFVPFTNGAPAGKPVEVVTGFLTSDSKSARGRPVGLAVDHGGGLLIADDLGNTVWRVTAG